MQKKVAESKKVTSHRGRGRAGRSQAGGGKRKAARERASLSERRGQLPLPPRPHSTLQEVPAHAAKASPSECGFCAPALTSTPFLRGGFKDAGFSVDPLGF